MEETFEGVFETFTDGIAIVRLLEPFRVVPDLDDIANGEYQELTDFILAAVGAIIPDAVLDAIIADPASRDGLSDAGFDALTALRDDNNPIPLLAIFETAEALTLNKGVGESFLETVLAALGLEDPRIDAGIMFVGGPAGEAIIGGEGDDDLSGAG